MRVGSRAGCAVAASIGVHALLVAVVAVLTRQAPERPTATRPTFDTRVTFGADPVPESREPATVLPVPEPDPPVVSDHPQAPGLVERGPPVETGGLSAHSLPRTIAVPAPLTDKMLARIRDSATAPALIVDSQVKPAAAVAPLPPTAQPAHGALAAGQRVVYLLDASGSMGEWGKFNRARDVLAATAALQPAAVDVKVVVYAAAAEVVTPAALAARSPLGRGDHLAGLRAALGQAPDFVVWFTDADDLPTAAVRTLLRRGKPVTLVVARVGADGVAAPVELR